MLQKNHHFLFPQTYFGPIEPQEIVFFDDQEEDEEEEISHVPWVLVLESENSTQLDPKIGLYIQWIDQS
jgi:hypothetical protein